MIESPFESAVMFSIGPVPITHAVVVTWAIMLLLTLISILISRNLRLLPGKVQSTVELFVTVVDSQIKDTMRVSPGAYRAFVGTIFLFILIANWSSLLPGVVPPTATLETDAALALIVLVATIIHGIRTRGVLGYLKSFATPSWVMIPINLFEQITRTVSMIIRLFGNVMSGIFIIGIVLSLAGLLVPVPLMALDLLTGTVQAYIFAVLTMVFIGAAIETSDTATNDDLTASKNFDNTSDLPTDSEKRSKHDELS